MGANPPAIPARALNGRRPPRRPPQPRHRARFRSARGVWPHERFLRVSDDVVWLLAAADGDHDAVRRLLDEAGPILYGYVFGRVGGDEEVAADIVQDTFLEAMRGAATFRGDSAVTTWLCSIASRRLSRHYEAERRQEEARRGLAAVPNRVERETLDDVAERDLVVRALGRLPALHRQVLVMKYLDGRAVAEIATELGRTRVQIQSLLQRARDALRAAVEVVA